MSAKYRLVQFIPNPMKDERVTLAALVQHRGSIAVARADQQVNAACIGGDESAALVSMMMADLSAHQPTAFDKLPDELGPYASLSEARELPAAIDNPVAWIEKLMARPEHTEGATSIPRTPKAVALAYRFFEQYRVKAYVKKSFHAETDWGGRINFATNLENVSQWVEGRDSLLLMEPIVPQRPDILDVVKVVNTRFAAYRSELNQRNEVSTRLISFVLDGGTLAQRNEAIGRLQGHGSEVIDVSVESQRVDFINDIRSVGSSIQLQV